LSTITLSPSSRPPVTTALLPIQLDACTGLGFALPSGPMVMTMRDCSLCSTAACGTSIAVCSPARMRAFTNWPGIQRCDALANSARSVHGAKLRVDGVAG